LDHLPTFILNNGVSMPALGLGVFRSTAAETATAVQTAIETGYRLIDTAAAYNNERQVGEGIARSGIDRDELFVTTKLWITDYGFEPAHAGFEASLRRLGLDHIDLYLLHWPVPARYEDTIAAYRAAETFLADGRARAIGVCNHSPSHLQHLLAATDVVPAVNQVELNPYFSQRDLRDVDREHGMVTQAWSPLGGVNVYEPSDPSAIANPLDNELVGQIASTHERTPAQVILRWHLQSGLSAIPKSVKEHRIRENFDVAGFQLTEAEMLALDGLDTGVRGGADPEHYGEDGSRYFVDRD
jgi:diketogulonate reductase-like aldo/keto reductase